MTTHSPTQHHRPNFAFYDTVIVGARAAGASTAMLLARAGQRVLVVDRQGYGSDTMSTHALMKGAVRRLAHWGLLDQVLADTPLIDKTVFSYGDETFTIDIRPRPSVPGLAAPRRTVLDPILVDAAVAAGAEVLHDTRMTGLVTDTTGRVRGIDLDLADGTEATVGADLVIGADGLRSTVARAVEAPITRQATHTSASIMRYYRADRADVPAIDYGAYRWIYQPGIGGGIIPTSDGTFCVFTSMTPERFRNEARGDVAGTHQQVAHELDPTLGGIVRQATPLGPVRGFPGMLGQFRTPVGPGWALVGDAGYFKDPYSAHGITDAFRDAELLTRAVLTNDLDGFESTRDELSMPVFDLVDQIASHDWTLDELKTMHYQFSKAMSAEDDATIDTLNGLGLVLEPSPTAAVAA